MGIIMKTIGPTFSAELAVAGLIGLPFTWGNDGQFNFGEEITKIQKGKILAVYEAHDPTSVDPASVRKERDALLAESDWTDMVSAPGRLGETLYAAWQAYRQALRDVTSQAGFPNSITWPTKP